MEDRHSIGVARVVGEHLPSSRSLRLPRASSTQTVNSTRRCRPARQAVTGYCAPSPIRASSRRHQSAGVGRARRDCALVRQSSRVDDGKDLHRPSRRVGRFGLHLRTPRHDGTAGGGRRVSARLVASARRAVAGRRRRHRAGGALTRDRSAHSAYSAAPDRDRVRVFRVFRGPESGPFRVFRVFRGPWIPRDSACPRYSAVPRFRGSAARGPA